MKRVSTRHSYRITAAPPASAPPPPVANVLALVLASVLAFGLASASAPAAADTSAAEKRFPGVEGLMSAEEFRASGLHRLSPAELEALDGWLLRYTAGDAQVLQQTNKAVREAEEEHEIVSRITGDFSGWEGETIFTLENGQRWQQRLRGRYRYKGPPNPEVRIDRNWFGFYRLTLTETGRSVGVSPAE